MPPSEQATSAAEALAAWSQIRRIMAIGTPLGPDRLLLKSFSVSEGLGRLFTISAELLSTDPNIDFDQIVGQNVTIRLELPNGGTRYFNGLVSTFAQRGPLGRFARYEATIVPNLWLLTRTSDCRIFQNKPVPEIVKEVCREHGISDIEERLSRSYRDWEYCVQYRETDFNFISRLMEQEGIYYFFTHENGKHTLVLCDSPTAHEPFPGYEQISFRPEATGSSDIERIRDWAVEKRVQPGAFVLNDFDFKNPRKSLIAQAKIDRDHLASDFEMYDFPGEYTDFNDGEQYARLRIEELHAQHQVARGIADARGIAAGHTFALLDYPRLDQCGNYLVVSCSLTAQGDEFDARGTPMGRGPICVVNFAAISADEPFRPPRLAPKPVVEGPQTAIVVGPSGEEIYTDEFGRVKVQFHWDRRGKADENSSCWIRVAQLWAGKKWGAMFIPRIGQEVIVEFLEGDPDRPIITGRVYNGEEMPPYELPAEKTKSTVKSNSSPDGGGFNEIRFEDKKGKEQIFIHAQRNKDERVRATSKEYVGYDRHLIVKHDQFEKVEGDKHLTVNGDHNEQVDGTISITAGMDRQEKTGMNYAHEAGMEVHIKAGMNVVIEAGVSITLKAGGSFITIGPGPIYISGTPTFINSGGSPGNGSGASPETPEEPVAAATGKPGETDKAPKKPRPPKPATYSAQAKVLKLAAEDGTPFCEQCAAAAAQQQTQA